MKAVLRIYDKYQFKSRYTIEISLFEIDDRKRYPNGVKYAVICVDTKTGDKVLMDNHHPKGDHIHFNERQIAYQFESPEKLIEDFKQLVLRELGVKL